MSSTTKATDEIDQASRDLDVPPIQPADIKATTHSNAGSKAQRGRSPLE